MDSSDSQIFEQTSRALPAGLTASDFLSVNRPAQYLGGELNSIIKSEADVDFHFALSFPDLYEVGMSHLGIQILYDVINQIDGVWAERVYMPEADLEQILRERGASLFSLESKRAVKNFDILGFSLQYELCGTNILAMLDLSQIPLYAADRTDEHPLIIGGGPYSYHPEALAPFFDAFFLGDAEEGIKDVIQCVRRLKQSGIKNRVALLEALSEIDGVYVPSHFEPVYENGKLVRIEPLRKKQTVVRRLLPSMEGAPFPTAPVVPNVKTIHNRLSVEVMRGCVRGCRFCQAGYLYRPQRERTPQEILKIVDSALPQTGFEEVSLLSLSTADYCSVVPLLQSLMDRYGEGDQLSISFPSTRVDALTPEVLEQIQRVRRTNLTLAPEGGTQRLRDVINKGVSDEQIIETCRNVFAMGWTGVKLYFMLGLPTETDEDLLGIIELAQRLKALPGARGRDITVSVSTFVPKPHTPFQWASQIDRNETIRKQRFLLERLKKEKVNLRYHDPFSSFLEGIFCRGGREVARAVVRAYELGCRLDAWPEMIEEELWTQAFLETGIDPYAYLNEQSVTATLPWDHLSCGIPKAYFQKEYERALRDRVTPDCLTTSCSICGACNYDSHRNVLWPRSETEQALPRVKNEREDAPRTIVAKYRIKYQKKGSLRFIGHLELTTLFQRACRRAELPMAYSGGYHPLMRISFGAPLQLGIESESEFADLELARELDAQAVFERMKSVLPKNLVLESLEQVPVNALAPQRIIAGYKYTVRWLTEPQGFVAAELAPDEVIQQILQATIKRKKDSRKSKTIPLDFVVSETISNVSLLPISESHPFGGCEFQYDSDPVRAQPRPLEVVFAISGLGLGEIEIRKTETIFRPELLQREAAPTEQTAESCSAPS